MRQSWCSSVIFYPKSKAVEDGEAVQRSKEIHRGAGKFSQTGKVQVKAKQMSQNTGKTNDEIRLDEPAN